MMPLRSRMFCVTTSSSASRSATSRPRSASGITPTVWPPAARAARASRPIMDTDPPPETHVQPR